MQDLPQRSVDTEHCVPPPTIPIERVSIELLHRAAAAMRKAWPELDGVATRMGGEGVTVGAAEPGEQQEVHVGGDAVQGAGVAVADL